GSLVERERHRCSPRALYLPATGAAAGRSVPRMPALTAANGAIWLICALALLGVLLRPFRLVEATWAVAGAAVLAVTRLLPLAAVGGAVGRGLNVHLFL